MRSDTYEIVREVAGIAATPATMTERAQALLAPLRQLVPFVAGRLYLLDVPRRAKHSLVCVGYDDKVRSFLEGPRHLDEIELLGLTRKGPPLRIRDMPLPPEQIAGWHHHLAPAGFREAIAVPLSTTDGRYLGILALNTDDPDHPTDAARDTLAALSSTVAAAVDPLRSISASAGLVRNAMAGALLDRDGATQPLAGLPSHPSLATGSPLLRTAIDQLKGTHRASFLCPDDRATTGLVQVTVLACPPWPPAYITAAVVLSTPTDLHRLTRRELHVLALLIEGHANTRIARLLQVTEKTVNTHLEHIRQKLRTPSRTLAAAQAFRQGLYIPHALAPSGPHRPPAPAHTAGGQAATWRSSLPLGHTADVRRDML